MAKETPDIYETLQNLSRFVSGEHVFPDGGNTTICEIKFGWNVIYIFTQTHLWRYDPNAGDIDENGTMELIADIGGH